jgi:hypothetical protein
VRILTATELLELQLEQPTATIETTGPRNRSVGKFLLQTSLLHRTVIRENVIKVE